MDGKPSIKTDISPPQTVRPIQNLNWLSPRFDSILIAFRTRHNALSIGAPYPLFFTAKPLRDEDPCISYLSTSCTVPTYATFPKLTVAFIDATTDLLTLCGVINYSKR